MLDLFSGISQWIYTHKLGLHELCIDCAGVCTYLEQHRRLALLSSCLAKDKHSALGEPLTL